MFNFKKLIFVFFLIFVLAMPSMAFADESIDDLKSGANLNKEVENLLSDSLEGYEYVEYSEPIMENYNGETEVLLGYYIPKKFVEGEIQVADYREYDLWKVYDQGITKSWSYLSNPYFIKSIARGMTYEKSKEISTTITASYDGAFPKASKSAINSAFKISGSGTKKVVEKVTLSGPGKGYSSRDFYYKKGRHTHKVKIVQEHKSNWDGLLWKKTHYASVGVPAVKTYSVDKK